MFDAGVPRISIATSTISSCFAAIASVAAAQPRMSPPPPLLLLLLLRLLKLRVRDKLPAATFHASAERSRPKVAAGFQRISNTNAC